MVIFISLTNYLAAGSAPVLTPQQELEGELAATGNLFGRTLYPLSLALSRGVRARSLTANRSLYRHTPLFSRISWMAFAAAAQLTLTRPECKYLNEVIEGWEDHLL